MCNAADLLQKLLMLLRERGSLCRMTDRQKYNLITSSKFDHFIENKFFEKEIMNYIN